MEKLCFNLGWKVRNGISNPFDAIFQGGAAAGEPVTLPQDAMVLEARDPNCAAKNQAGYYPAKTYTYTKTFSVPEDWAEKANVIEFEGVMAQAQVFLNNQFLACHKYGYSSFSVDLGKYLRFGEENTLKVIAVNQELASRWYP